jgi:3-mercaptopyruvate sulfurtransferase SseA
MKASEQQTAERTISALLAAGYSLGVYDGEETTVEHSTNAAEVLAAMGTTDEDRLLVYANSGEMPYKRIGWVLFVWGNEDWVAIADNTTNLEDALKPVTDWVEEQSNAAELKFISKG